MEPDHVTVLVIDDDPGDVELLRRHLESIREWKTDLLASASPEDAVPVLAGRHVDVVLLDYRLGAETGLGMLQALTHSGEEICRAVIMVTGQGDEEIAAEAIKAGALDYLSKSRLRPETLYHSIRSALEKVELRRQLELQRRELVRLARCDELTGLLNRRAFLARLDQEFDRSRRHGSPLCVMLLDLDHFKSVNDAWGHLAGDRVLRSVGHALRDMTRSTDAAGRLGGEEFGVLLVEARLEGARIFAERLRARIGALAHRVRGDEVQRVTCSIGLAAFSGRLASPRALLECADKALYRAKAAGRDCIRE